jgi:DNA invertase Pin-like site-specific DNA recombinase
VTSPFQPGDLVVAYLRDSGHEDQELSVEQQEAAIRAWCDDQQLILTRLFIDAAAPGSSTVGRGQFLEMISYFHRSPAEKGVVIWKFNRFARSMDDAQYYKADLRRRGYDVHSLNDAVSNDLNGRFYESAIDWMNARYIEDLRADIKRGLHHLVDQYGGIGGTPPRGFIRVPIELGTRRDGRPHIVHRWSPDPDLVDTIRLAFRMRGEGRSLSEINRKTNLYRSNASLVTMFRNRIYIGELIFGDYVIPNYCEPIIDLPTWQAVQKMRPSTAVKTERINSSHPRRVSSSYLLSGLARCASCGAPMNGDTVSYTVKGQRKRYQYYACTNRLCNARKIPKANLENAVISTLVEVALGEENIIGMQAEFERDQAVIVDELDGQRREVKSQIKEIQRKIDNILDVLADQGKNASPALLSRLSALETEHTRLTSTLHDLNAASVPAITSLSEAQARADRIKQKLAGKDPGQLKRILRGLIDHLTVERNEQRHVITGMVFFYYPPDEDVSDDDFMPLRVCPRRDSNPQPRR